MSELRAQTMVRWDQYYLYKARVQTVFGLCDHAVRLAIYLEHILDRLAREDNIPGSPFTNTLGCVTIASIREKSEADLRQLLDSVEDEAEVKRLATQLQNTLHGALQRRGCVIDHDIVRQRRRKGN